jgi:transcriptional regulator GlxA family with amidase domain
VTAMIQVSGLPERSFKRRLQQAAGMSPLAYVHTLRLEEARQMLESDSQPIEAIANKVGCEDAGFSADYFAER